MAGDENNNQSRENRDTQSVESTYRMERPSPHGVMEDYQQTNEARAELDRRAESATAEGLLDGVKGVVDAGVERGGYNEQADAWLKEKHGAFPYSDAVNTFDMEKDRIEMIAERAIEQARDQNAAFEQGQNTETRADATIEREEAAAEDIARREQEMEARADAILDRLGDGHDADQSLGNENSLGNDFSNGR